MENNDKINYDTQAAKTLGDELRKHRTDAKIDIEDVASRLKLSVEQIDALEKGNIQIFRAWSSSQAIFVHMHDSSKSMNKPSPNICTRLLRNLKTMYMQ